MKPPSANPFNEAYVTHTVSETSFVHYFSPILVDQAVAIFQPGNVIVKGTQGSGKSMLLRLLDPKIRIAYHDVTSRNASPDHVFSVPHEYRCFVAARVDLNKSGLLDIVNTLSAEPSHDELKNLTKSFGDFFNFWLFRGIIESMECALERPEAFEDLVNKGNLDVFAKELAGEDCWFGALSGVNDWTSLKEAVKRRVISYRSWSNGNADLAEAVKTSRGVIGEPLSQVANHLRQSGVLPEGAQVYLTIDQMEALWMRGGVKQEVGEAFRREIHEILGRRDSRVSYRIGARRYDWEKGGHLAMRDGRELEEARDFRVVDIDQLLRRQENAKAWAFKRFARDVFRRRVCTAVQEAGSAWPGLVNAQSFFGPSPTGQELIAQLIRKPDPKGVKLLRLDDKWSPEWREAIAACYERRIPGIPSPPPDNYPFDPLNALLLAAWGLQNGGKVGAPSRRDTEAPPQSSDDAPWNAAKLWWRKERRPQAVLQLVSRHQQQLAWWGEAQILSLTGSNILRFITICRETWDYWQRIPSDSSVEESDESDTRIVPIEVQKSAISFASEKIYDALKRQPGHPAGDVRLRFLDQLAGWLRNQLLNDLAMSYPGQNGFSLKESELRNEPELQQLIEEAVGWGDLYEVPHTSKTKGERFRDPRHKYYLNPSLSPVYQIPESHTKEPVYHALEKLREFALAAGFFTVTGKPKVNLSERVDSNQQHLPLDFKNE
jgi:hypothetical protein